METQERHSSLAQRTWAFIRIINVRLRFVFLMIVVGIVVGYWDSLANHYQRWRRPAHAPDLLADQTAEYYCPMHPNIVRADAGNCPVCGMPLVKRAKTQRGETPEGALAQVQLTPQKIQLGRIATSPVEYRLLAREIRTVGVIDYDETRRAFIAARIKGRIDELLVNYVGQRVAQGDPLVKIYSPALFTAQQELLSAARAPAGQSDVTARPLLEAARQKLLLWGITDEQIEEIIRRGTIETHLVIYSPISGIVTDKKVLEGHYVSEGDDLYTIADLSRVWMQIKIFEDQIAGIDMGTAVEVFPTAYPEQTFAGRISFIAYNVDAETRTVSARVEVDNPEYRLKPGMYANAVIRVPVGQVTPLGETEPSTQPAIDEHIDTRELAAAYLKLVSAQARDALDDAAPAELAAAARALADGGPPEIRDLAKQLEDPSRQLVGKTLPQQRAALKPLSAAAIKLLRAYPPAGQKLYIIHCPMVEADWLQTSQNISNPYYGAEMLRCGEVTGEIQADDLRDSQRFATGYFCPVYPQQLFDAPHQCPIDKFPLKLVRIEKMLSVSQSAVVNSGTRRVVYRESAPGVFDMLEVQLGQRAGEFYPVLAGLHAGEHVATSGAFLVDAENRLNPAAAVQYFGASGAPAANQGAPH